MTTQLNQQPVALRVNQLSVNYDKTPVLWDISLTVPTGRLVAIIGPNGAGKTTFIKTILDLVKPISGKIELLDKPLKQVQKLVAYVPQRQSVDWEFPITVRDLVLMGRYGRIGLFRWPTKKDVADANHYLEMVDMAQYGDRQINQLSGGQQQRVFIARSLLQDASIYFLDEPFAGIDIASETVIMNILRNLKSEGKTVFVVHHDLNTVENYFDWAILLNIRLIANGEIKNVFNAKTLNTAYGKNYALFDEAFKLSQQKASGIL